MRPSQKDKIYDYLCRFYQKNGYPPSMGKIAAALGLSARSNINRQLGTIAAGVPITAIENLDGYIGFIPRSGHHDKDLFALRVKGDSMINAGIFSGDIVIVEQTPVADNGQIVAAMVDGEATVKRFYKEKGHFRLQPENPSMEPIIVPEVEILGRVVSSMRYYN